MQQIPRKNPPLLPFYNYLLRLWLYLTIMTYSNREQNNREIRKFLRKITKGCHEDKILEVQDKMTLRFRFLFATSVFIKSMKHIKKKTSLLSPTIC